MRRLGAPPPGRPDRPFLWIVPLTLAVSSEGLDLVLGTAAPVVMVVE
ncbi:MAG TPA: hypothetical protein VJT32_15570 [bacterium]|nr:hypothetical protein [bacterium]